jgi:uroporphyrinogen-III decarboxylase
MTPRQRVCAALTGRPVDRVPVVAPYLNLYAVDHFGELTGLPQWRVHEWLHASPERYVELLATMLERAPFELLFPHGAAARGWRERQRFESRDGVPFRLDRETGDECSLATVSGMTMDDRPNQTRRLWSEDDVRERLRVVTAAELHAQGYDDYIRATVGALGEEHFVVAGGVVGAVWGCVCHLGFEQTLSMLIEEPEFVDCVTDALLRQAREDVRYYARTGGAAVFVDESAATTELLSPAQYERFALPYTREVVREIRAHGLVSIVYYFGSAMDLLSQIAETGADAVLVECSMKGYENDIGRIAERVGGRVSLFGNIDPVWVLERGSDERLEREVRRQLAAGRQARGFLLSTGSPVTPDTPLARVRQYLELGERLGRV